MSTEAQRNAANGSGNMFTLSADLSEITPVAKFAPNSIPEVSTLPDGTIAMPGPLAAPNVEKPIIRVGIIGDSLTVNNGPTGGYLQYAMIASGGRLCQVVCSGVGGNTPAQMDARFSTVFNATQRLDEIWIGCGTNGAPISDATKSAIASMCQKAIALGARPILFLPPPSQNNYADRNTVGIWMRRFADKNRIEWNYLWPDAIDTATGLAKAGIWYEGDTAGDGLHPNYTGQKLAGDRYAADRFRGANARPSGLLYTWNGTSGRNQLVDKPFNTSGSPLANGFAASGNGLGTAGVTASIVACDAPDYGNWQKAAFVLNDTNTGAYLIRTVGGFTAGKEYEFCHRIKFDEATISNPATQSLLSLSHYIEWRSAGNVQIGESVVYHSFLRTDFDGTICMASKCPEGAVSANMCWIASRQTGGGRTSTADLFVGMIGIEELEQV